MADLLPPQPVAVTRLVEAPLVRAGLEALALRMDGAPAAATTMRRKRAVFYNLLQYAVELELLDFNPVDRLKVKARRKRVVTEAHRRVVVNPVQVLELLTMLTYVGSRGDRGGRLVAFFACLYFAVMRPSEALGLRVQDCHLSGSGWGLLTLERSRPQSGRRWTDSGEVHDDRGLKHRGEEEPRYVPIPPVLVAILRGHIERFGVAADGRLFVSRSGNVVAASTYSRVWDEVRGLALLPHQVESPLAGRPYDLRHAGVSFWLNAGVPATAVAERAGNSVEVLLKIYAKCIDDEDTTLNARIEQALGGLAWPL